MNSPVMGSCTVSGRSPEVNPVSSPEARARAANLTLQKPAYLTSVPMAGDASLRSNLGGEESGGPWFQSPVPLHAESAASWGVDSSSPDEVCRTVLLPVAVASFQDGESDPAEGPRV